jgi:hypothetical protein
VTSTVADRPPISLAELVEEAELLTRFDRKYLVPMTDLPAILDGLPAGTRVLDIDGRRDFAYRSAYFDTPALQSYLAAARGRRHRFKLRIRSYVDSDVHFFEVKTRGSRGTTTKQRIPYGGEPTLSPAAAAYAAELLGLQLDLEHVLTTRYHRQTFLLPAGGARLTVDTRLAWELPEGPAVRTPEWAVVETKSAAGASAADRLLWSLHHRPRAVSKYGTGLAALRPDLPSNRWRPVLRMFPTTPRACNGATWPAVAEQRPTPDAVRAGAESRRHAEPLPESTSAASAHAPPRSERGSAHADAPLPAGDGHISIGKAPR